MVAADTSLELEASLQGLGVPLASILEAHGCSGDWCKDSAARIAIGAWLLRFIDRWTVQSQAPRLPGGEEDVTALARVAEAMGVAPAGQGAVLLGLSGGSLSHRPASSAATSARGQKGGKGGAAHGGSDASAPAPWQPGDGMEMLRRAIDLAKEAEEWDNAGGWQVIERRRAGDRSVISEVARVASLSGNADGAEVFSTSTQLVLPQMPAPVISAMAGLKAEHAGGHAKAGKAWAASLEDELAAVRNTHAERERELGDAKARAERGFAFDGSEADTVGGVRDVETGKLVEALSAMNESVDKFNRMHDHVGAAVRRVARPRVHAHLGSAAAAVHEQKSQSTRLLAALWDIRRADSEISAACSSSGMTGELARDAVDIARLSARSEVISKSLALGAR